MNEGIISVFWSEADSEWVAIHSDFPSLSWIDGSPEAAKAGLVELLNGFQ